MKAVADRVARRPWSVPLFVVGGALTCLDIWWLISTSHPRWVRIDPGPVFLGMPVLWMAVGGFLLGPICLGIALYRLLTD